MKIINIISYIAILLGILTILTVTYWLTYPYEPLVFQDEKFPVINKIIKRGEMVVYTSNYCKYADLPALVTRTFKNELIFLTPTSITNRPIGCNSITIAVTIPKELPSGIFRLENTYEFQVNPIRKIIVLEDTEDFQVVD
jgi:hypothetical protein